MRILLIEDEKRFGQSLKGLLESESYAVDWFQNGTDGLKQGIYEEYDVAIIDVGLPDISGLEVVKKLREAGETMPILMLTALSQLKDKVDGLDSGADDYVVKPVLFEELLARLRSLLRRPPVVKPIIYKCGSLKMDLAKRDVTRCGKLINLSLKEFGLLEYLIRNAGTTLSRQDLIDHVWDGSLDPFSNTVDVHIGYLRNKIDKAFPKEPAIIHTIRGVGYRLQDI